MGKQEKQTKTQTLRLSFVGLKYNDFTFGFKGEVFVFKYHYSKSQKNLSKLALVSKISPTFETLFGENKTKKDFFVS